MTSNSVLWITTIVMAGGGALILLIGKRRTHAEEMQTVLHGIVPLIAACSYLAMATGQGLVLLPTGAGSTRVFYYARYIDWAFTTPLLLLSLSLTAMHAGRKRLGAITGMLLADLMMIATAFLFSASEIAWMRWTWFIISCAAFLGVYYVIWISALQANAQERADVRASYRRNASILSVLWLIYPLALAISPDGLGVIGDAGGVLFIAILDVVSKVAYGLQATRSDAKSTELDLAERTRTTPLRSAA